MTDTTATLFEQALERYKAGETPETLIPIFKELRDRAPKNPAIWTSLAWLYLLAEKPKSALKAAQKAVKCDKNAPQARVNLALALLETNTKGVRQHIEVVQQILSMDSQIRDDVKENIEDGFTRKPDWKSLKRVQTWLFE